MIEHLRLTLQHMNPRAELLHLVSEAGWINAETRILANGVTIRFRDAPYTSDWGGMKTRYASGSTDLDAYRALLVDIETERSRENAESHEPNPETVELIGFYTLESLWPKTGVDHNRPFDVMAITNELTRGHAALTYDNLIFRMHPDMGRTAVLRWVESGLRDGLPNDAIQRIRIVCHPNHKRNYVSLSVVPLDGDRSCI